MSSSTPRFLSVCEVADLLRVHTKTVLRWIREGRLPAIQVSRDYRIDIADLERLKQRKKTPIRGKRLGA